MTTIITRYFEDALDARAAWHELRHHRRLSPKIMEIFEARDGLEQKLAEARVEPGPAKVYMERMSKGGAVLLVKAGFKPLGVAQFTRDVAAEMGAVPIDGVEEEAWYKDRPSPGRSILEDHPLIMTRPLSAPDNTYHMADWPIPLTMRRSAPERVVLKGHPHFMDFAFPLLDDRKPYTGSIVTPHARMANWPIPLLSDRKPYDEMAFPRHARMANFPLPLTIGKRPNRDRLIRTHTRMANWPFPLLIDGERHTNSVIPGQPHMANFPIRLISHRKHSNASIFPRHARMANFPIRLISRRKPFTGSIIAPHARMADKILPLVIRRTGRAGPNGGEGFSFSRLLGLRTISRH